MAWPRLRDAWQSVLGLAAAPAQGMPARRDAIGTPCRQPRAAKRAWRRQHGCQRGRAARSRSDAPERSPHPTSPCRAPLKSSSRSQPRPFSSRVSRRSRLKVAVGRTKHPRPASAAVPPALRLTSSPVRQALAAGTVHGLATTDPGGRPIISRARPERLAHAVRPNRSSAGRRRSLRESLEPPHCESARLSPSGTSHRYSISNLCSP